MNTATKWLPLSKLPALGDPRGVEYVRRRGPEINTPDQPIYPMTMHDITTSIGYSYVTPTYYCAPCNTTTATSSSFRTGSTTGIAPR